MSWQVLCVKPRNEKKVATRLSNLGLQVYCPTVEVIRQWSDRKKKVVTPLFSSYVFVKVTPKERNLVFDVPGVVSYMFWLGKPAIVKDQEIDLIQKYLQGTVLEAKVEKIQPGDCIQIQSGPFQGKEGVVHLLNKTSVQLFLKELGMKISLQLGEIKEND